ncbi:MAG: hypothetical protein U0790_21370 [Isosphaeraceae bacterium]
MRRVAAAMFALWVLSGVPAIRGSDDAGKKPGQPEKSPKEKFQAVLDEYQEEMKVFSQAYSKAKTQEERTKLVSEKYPDRKKYARRYLEIADAAPEDPVAVEALIWNARLGSGVDTSKALKRLAEKHAADPKLAPNIPSLAFSASPSAEALLRAVIEKNPDRTSRGMAMLTLGILLKERPELIASLARKDQEAGQLEESLIKNGYDRAALARLKATDTAALNREIESIFERVVKEFGDISYMRDTLGKQAANELRGIRDLGIGRPCPEIAGEDIDGKSFKLSDYRGKVVVVDFWGDW